ncbi:MAG: dTDP-4-dehydrorhamnose reductase [Bacteroidaceae bacterium]|nr:dTDP-4-dehydrorhamnose reductase [Bacteroidaceae bacterium]MBR6628413.1 dTDP-4-dehydrorhamnose reductase [Bacteroidaceae bacterium]
MKNILITGANGQLGNEMRVVSAEQEQLTYHFTDVAELDICDIEAIERYVVDHAIDCIVNCAAYTNVNKAEEDTELCDKLNHLAPANLARVAAKHQIGLIHVSTDYVFNGEHYVPYKEDEPTCPNSVYGATKLAGEQAILSIHPEAVVIRTAWLYSTFGNNFVKTMLRLGSEREELGVVFDQIGTPTYARDLARTIQHIMVKGIVPGIYHYSNEGVCSWYDFTKMIFALGGITTCQLKPLHTDEYPTPAARPHYSVLDKTKIKQTYGIDVPYWVDSLRECISSVVSYEL